ncbi:MAG: patatin-like phospholipase family protein [Acidobacteriota bacterium]
MEIPDQSFGNIALSLSGGGYRAAAFHLGTLEMLNELGLLSSVTILSTVSGGTITGMAFALADMSGEDAFNSVKNLLYDFMLFGGKNVITAALSQLEPSSHINNDDFMPSVIRAAASIYASPKLFGEKTFDALPVAGSRLREISFNATDFRNGSSFRFQKSAGGFAPSGSDHAAIPPGRVLEAVRLADIVAASSCFPGGFEPLRFPSDFVWTDPALSYVQTALKDNFGEIPLMDGGVFDNQGIDSILNVLHRQNVLADLLIVSDTTHRASTLLEFPTAPRRRGISLRSIAILLIAAFICSIVTIGAFLQELCESIANGGPGWFRGTFMFGFPLGLSILTAVLLAGAGWGWWWASRLTYEKTGVKLWRDAGKLTIPQIIDLIGGRVKSVLVMTSSVFMGRIRALGFDRVYTDPNIRPTVMPNLIYDLDNSPLWGKEIVDRKLSPSDHLRTVAKQAESFPTTLRIEKDELDNLILCGRATTCFKVIKYLLQHRADKIDDGVSPEFHLFSHATNIWKDLNRR